MPNNKKRKKIYSKVKTPILLVDEPPENPMQFISKFYEKENIWSRFIDKVIFGNKKLDLPKHQNLKYVIDAMKNPQMQRDILNRLMNYENYNPFTDEIPLHIFPMNYRRYLIKLQRSMQETEKHAKTVEKRFKEIEIAGKKHLLCIVTQATKNINKELFEQGIDIVVIFNNNKYVLSSNPYKKERISFLKLYEKLNKSEPDTWYLHGHQGILMVKYNKTSKLSSKQLLLELHNSFKK